MQTRRLQTGSYGQEISCHRTQSGGTRSHPYERRPDTVRRHRQGLHQPAPPTTSPSSRAAAPITPPVSTKLRTLSKASALTPAPTSPASASAPWSQTARVAPTGESPTTDVQERLPTLEVDISTAQRTRQEFGESKSPQFLATFNFHNVFDTNDQGVEGPIPECWGSCFRDTVNAGYEVYILSYTGEDNVQLRAQSQEDASDWSKRLERKYPELKRFLPIELHSCPTKT